MASLKHRKAYPSNKETRDEEKKKKPSSKSSFLWTVIKFSIFTVVLIVGLYVYNKWAILKEAKTYIPPGTMVELADGHSLYLNCKGPKDSKNPVIVLVMGFLAPEILWYHFQVKLVEEGWRTCTYDRSGIGWSEPSPDRFVTVQGYVEELHELIHVSGISKNQKGYILIGMSMGASIVGRYIEQWPIDAKGGFMIDPPIDIKDSLREYGNLQTTFFVLKYLAEFGLLRPLWFFGKMHPLFIINNIPSEVADTYRYLAAKPNGYYSGLLHESQLLLPDHGQFSNESTWKFIAKYDAIPVFVELREAAFILRTPNPTLDAYWKETRQVLKRILKDKQQTFLEDHTGSTHADESHSESFTRVYGRLKNFLSVFEK